MTKDMIRVELERKQRKAQGSAWPMSLALSYTDPSVGKIVCALCDEAWPEHLEHNLEIDHKVPVSSGGKDEMDNYQLVCPACNKIKGEKPNAVGRDLCMKEKMSRDAARAKMRMYPRMHPTAPGPRYSGR